MNTTIQEQMKAVKIAMGFVETSCKRIKKFGDIQHYTKDKTWIALNDAYSTLASVAIMKIQTQVIGNTIEETKRLTKKDLY